MTFDQRLVTLDDEHRFEDDTEQRAVWGRRWGATTEVGRLTSAVVRRPSTEMLAIDAARWSDDAHAAVDPNGRWYWLHREPPNLDRMQAQHDTLLAVLRSEGVTVHELGPLPGLFTKSVYVRDPFVAVPGGVIVTRLAPRMRRGEEAHVARSLAAIGVPIVATIVGDSFVEGGSFVKVTPDFALYGTGVRCPEDGAHQLGDLIARSGLTLRLVAQPPDALHLDGALAMVDVDKALIIRNRLPNDLPDLLRAHGVECIDCDEPWGVNLLALAPGRVVLSTSAPRTAATLRTHGIDVIDVPFDEIERNGGGIHCSTNELHREDIA
jgi:N-dimethylarginine dimethylaminohydrolase